MDSDHPRNRSMPAPPPRRAVRPRARIERVVECSVLRSHRENPMSPESSAGGRAVSFRRRRPGNLLLALLLLLSSVTAAPGHGNRIRRPNHIDALDVELAGRRRACGDTVQRRAHLFAAASGLR